MTSSGGLGGLRVVVLEGVRMGDASWRVSSETDNFEFWVHFPVLGGGGGLGGLGDCIFR